MGGGCCAVTSVLKPSLRHDGPLSRAKSFRNASESPSDRKALESFINTIIANNSPAEAIELLLRPYFDAHMHCNGAAQVLAHCQDCSRLLCAGCFMDELHVGHRVNLIQNQEQRRCQCTEGCFSNAKSACAMHTTLAFDNLLHIDLEVLLAAFTQGKQVIERLSAGDSIDSRQITANDFALRVLVFAGFFEGQDEEIATIDETDCVKLAKKVKALESRKWLFEQQNCRFLFTDQLFRTCCARWLAQCQENAFFRACFEFGFDAEAFQAFDVHIRALSGLAKQINRGEIALATEQARHFDVLEKCFSLAKRSQEAMEVVSFLLAALNSMFREQSVGFNASTAKFMTLFESYFVCVSNVVLPALNGIFSGQSAQNMRVSSLLNDSNETIAIAPDNIAGIVQRLIQQQQQVQRRAPGINETVQTAFCPLPDLTCQLLLADMFEHQSPKAVVKQLADLTKMTFEELVFLLLKEPVQWMADIEFVQLEDSLFNCRKLFSLFARDARYLRVYFSVCRFAAHLLGTQPQPFLIIQRSVSTSERFAARRELLATLVFIQIYAVEPRDSQCLGQEIMCNNYFLDKDCRRNTMAFEYPFGQVFQPQTRRDPLLSARLALKDLSFFRPQVFPLLPDYYFTNVMLSSQSVQLMDELCTRVTDCGISRVTDAFPCLEELYFDSAVKVQQKLRLLLLMLHRSFRSKKVLRFPEQRLRGLEEKVFKISQTTDFSRSFNRLLSNRSTQDCVFQDEETPCESFACSDATPISDDEQNCVYCQQRVLNPVYFAQIERMCSGKQFIKTCLHQAHYQCYVAQRSSCCPVCKMAVNYLLSDRQQMKDIGVLFFVSESQLLGVIIDSIEHCQFISRLADVPSEQKRRIIGLSLQTLRILQKLIYIGDARERQIEQLMRFSEQDHLLNPAVFPQSATRMYLAAAAEQKDSVSADAFAPLICLRCGATLSGECLCTCGGFLRWNVCRNRIESNNGMLDLPAPYRNEGQQVPDSIFRCGELLFDGAMLDEIKKRVLK